MLNNFCFHVYAQKSLFKVENVKAYFLTSSSSLTSAPREFANHRAGSQLKMSDKSWEPGTLSLSLAHSLQFFMVSENSEPKSSTLAYVTYTH